MLYIKGARSGVDPSNLCIDTVLRRKDQVGRSNDYLENQCPWTSSNDDPPLSSIISTCRTIATEAAPILYRENTFQFDLNHTDSGPSMLSADSIREFSKNICRYDADNWILRDSALRSAVFAAFLYVIGPVNAGTLTSLSFSSRDADCAASGLTVVTGLIARNVLSLRRLRIYVDGRHIDPEEGTPDWYHPESSSSYYAFWRNGGFWPLGEALKKFVDRVTWLEEFEYEGQTILQHQYSYNHGLESWWWERNASECESWLKLKSLEKAVRRRAHAQNGLEAMRYLFGES